MERLDEPAPPLAAERLGAEEAPVDLGGRVTLVHFWATWCGPCREELPGLLANARALGVPTLALTDEPWPEVQTWFLGSVPAEVARDPGGRGREAFGVSGLPETFLVARGRIVARVGGAREWTQRSARKFLLSAGER